MVVLEIANLAFEKLRLKYVFFGLFDF